MAKKKYDYQPEIRITGVGKELHSDLNNIADHLGIPLVSMLKPKLREIRDSFPEEMRQPKID